jgi:hypothetical protein
MLMNTDGREENPSARCAPYVARVATEADDTKAARTRMQRAAAKQLKNNVVFASLLAAVCISAHAL